MVGSDPKFQTCGRLGPLKSSDSCRTGSRRLRRIARLSLLIPLSFVLAQCGRSPTPGMQAANSQASKGDSFDDRFPKPQFKDRFPTASESLVQRQAGDLSGPRTASAEPAPYRV